MQFIIVLWGAIDHRYWFNESDVEVSSGEVGAIGSGR